MKRKIIKLTLNPYDVTGHSRMNLSLNKGDEFTELETSLEPPEDGHVCGTAFGIEMWVPESHLSPRS